MSQKPQAQQRSEVLVIGGGIIGLCTAYFAAGMGAQVTLIDHAGLPGAASAGNAGLVVPTRCKPLPSPQTLRAGLSHLLLSGGAFAVPIRPDLDLFRWLLRFSLSSRRKHFEQSREILLRLGRRSLHMYNRWLSRPVEPPPFAPNGVLFPYFSRRRFEQAEKEAAKLGAHGIASRTLSPQEALEAEPALSLSLAGAILKEVEGFVHPARLLGWLKQEILSRGGTVLEGVEALGLVTSRAQQRVSVLTTEGAMEGEQIVLAAGARSRELMRARGLRLPLQGGKGYSLTFPSEPAPITRPLLAEEAHLAMTPLQEGLRVTGVLELSGSNASVDQRRLARVMDEARRCLPGLGQPKTRRLWRGLRPCTPDGLPLVGRLRQWPNLWIATGHANLGMTLGPATGMMMAEMLSGAPSFPEASALSPERFRL
jgi:D-amino-acid dehydrogenase